MSAARFRPVDASEASIRLTVEGVSIQVPAGMSVLAALLTAADARAEPDWFCAIGQCQRCRVWVNGQPAIACQRMAQDGDDVAIGNHWSG